MNFSDLNLGWRLNQTPQGGGGDGEEMMTFQTTRITTWAPFLLLACREGVVGGWGYRWGNQFTTTWKCTCRNGSKQEEPKGRAMSMKHLLVVWLTCSVTESTECLTRLIDLILQISCFVCWYCTDVNFINFSSLENLCERGGGGKLM